MIGNIASFVHNNGKILLLLLLLLLSLLLLLLVLFVIRPVLQLPHTAANHQNSLRFFFCFCF